MRLTYSLIREFDHIPVENPPPDQANALVGADVAGLLVVLLVRVILSFPPASVKHTSSSSISIKSFLRSKSSSAASTCFCVTCLTCACCSRLLPSLHSVASLSTDSIASRRAVVKAVRTKLSASDALACRACRVAVTFSRDKPGAQLSLAK